ncbi:MAG: hypothetical protein FJ090_04875 [Deltaproteobacteria bacterium]|nr:hypothetical protein [Deltaproteobacteria bacterium]
MAVTVEVRGAGDAQLGLIVRDGLPVSRGWRARTASITGWCCARARPAASARRAWTVTRQAVLTVRRKRMRMPTVVVCSPATTTVATGPFRSTGPPARRGGGDDQKAHAGA